ncbi:hypothetical protein GHT06_006747 [Daphnia sinensis]|uniref:Uncharacterized protein n=1 Tax=Daphnia sinensis TaxID=1820382 RepID=A0AAD5KFJ8_9CRUS|nr:hypothetical protein GHT06_006747 [Daphnia sinensis]
METFEDGVKTFFSLIPVMWVSGGNGGVNSATLECNFLFPDDASTRGSAIGEPSSWQHKSFKRFLHPITEWMEYTDLDLEARLIKKHCDDNLPFEEWTDFNEDGSLAKKRRSKLPAKIAGQPRVLKKVASKHVTPLRTLTQDSEGDDGDYESDSSLLYTNAAPFRTRVQPCFTTTTQVIAAGPLIQLAAGPLTQIAAGPLTPLLTGQTTPQASLYMPYSSSFQLQIDVGDNVRG